MKLLLFLAIFSLFIVSVGCDTTAQGKKQDCDSVAIAIAILEKASSPKMAGDITYQRITDYFKKKYAVKTSEQIDPADADAWGRKYEQELANGNTLGVAFDYDDFMKIMWKFRDLVDLTSRQRSDQVYVRFIRYNNSIEGTYGRSASKIGRVSVCLYPYNKSNAAIVDDGTDDSKPLNLGDLHP